MKQHTVEVLARGTSGLALGSGILTSLVDFVELYATFIGAVFTVLSFIFMIFFNILNRIKLNERDKNLKRLDHMDKTLNELLALNKAKGESNERKTKV